jgi:hypothetical protein
MERGARNVQKTQQQLDEHHQRITSLMNQLAEEYGRWNGWTTGIGRYVALGEYILEETPPGMPHDEWLEDARKSFLKWKEVYQITMTPPANLKA